MSSVAKRESLVSASPTVSEFRMVLISGMILLFQEVYWCICWKRMGIMTSSVCMPRLRGRAGDQPCEIAQTKCCNLSSLIQNGRFSIVGLSMTFLSTNKCVFCLTYSRKARWQS